MALANLTARAKKLYNPAMALAADKGIPVTIERKAPVPAAHATVKLPNGVVVSKAKYASFEQTLTDFGKRVAADPANVHKTTRDFGEKLLKMHMDDVRDGHEAQAAAWSKMRAGWRDEFAKDAELGRNRRDTSLRKMKALLDTYGKSVGDESLERLRDILGQTGAGDHVEVLRFVHWVASRMPVGKR